MTISVIYFTLPKTILNSPCVAWWVDDVKREFADDDGGCGWTGQLFVFRAAIAAAPPLQPHSIRLSEITCCNRSGAFSEALWILCQSRQFCNIIVQDIVGLPINLSQARIITRSEYRRQN